jgi:hypothetical protein
MLFSECSECTIIINMFESSDSSIITDDPKTSEFSIFFESSGPIDPHVNFGQGPGGTPDLLDAGGHCSWWVIPHVHIELF